MNKEAGYTILEVIVSLMVMGLVFSIILPGFYTSHLISEKGMIDRELGSKQRQLNLFFRKQIYQSDCLYVQNGQVYLRDLETPDYYNVYSHTGTYVWRYKFEKKYKNNEFERLGLIKSGYKSQFEKGLLAFSLDLVDPDHIVVTYQLEGDENQYEIYIEHGKKIINLPKS